MWLRNHLVRPLGLRSTGASPADPFPVLHVSRGLAVLGLDDRHLDFRVLLTRSPDAVICTTALRRHNTVGRTYFTLVGPVHRRLVPYLLNRATRSDWQAAPKNVSGRSRAPA